MTMRDGNPDPKQAKMMAKVFIVATVLGALAVFVNVTLRSYAIRQQQAELKRQNPAAVVQPGTPASQQPPAVAPAAEAPPAP